MDTTKTRKESKLYNEFLEKMNNVNWIKAIDILTKLADETKMDINKNYKITYIPHKHIKEEYCFFKKVEVINNYRKGIFTFDNRLSLESVEIVDLIITEKTDRL